VNLLTELYPDIAVRRFCSVFGKTRQGWYYANDASLKQDMTDSIVVRLIREHRQDHPRIGGRKLHFLMSSDLEKHQVKVGRDGLFDIMERYDLLIRQRKRRTITTDSNHPYFKHKNLIQHLTLNGRNQLWVSDITYLTTKKGFCYLSLITDAFSHKIVGYKLMESLSAKGPVDALMMALEQQRPKRNQLIHHSDRGVQYCCNDYTERLEISGIRISMSKKGDPYQNAIAERVNGILKQEYRLDKIFDDIDEALKALEKAVSLYNTKRPHDSIEKLTPNQAHEVTGMLKRHWKNYKKQGVKEKQD
jgi:putative transposase